MPINLERALDDLRERYSPSPGPARSAFEMMLWEQAAYLADDARRTATFLRLRDEVGTTPAAIAGTHVDALARIVAGGGIHAELRAERMRTSAEMVLRAHGGDLEQLLAAPLPVARRAFAAFPMIGEPGAEKILLFTRAHPILALESNGLRVLLRLGFGIEQKSYQASYRSAQAAAQRVLASDCTTLIEAHLLLRDHGRELCRRSRPACGSCPLRTQCVFAASSQE